jgi:transcriptional regulator with XRE-family HTH domain
MTDFIPNNEMEFEEVADFGQVLRTLRNNHGYTIQQLSKMIALPPNTISNVERSKSEVPNERTLRLWLTKLGCKRNLNKLLLLARTFKLKHWVRLHPNDISNADMIRLISAYQEEKLTHFDRLLLKVICR